MGQEGAIASSQVMQSYEAARKAGKIQDFVVVFPEKYGGTVGGTKRPETNVLKELLPYLEKNTPLPKIVGNGPLWGFQWERPARSIGEPSTSISSRRQWLWTREGVPFTDPQARNYVPEYGKKTKAIQETLKLRLVLDSTPESFGIPSAEDLLRLLSIASDIAAYQEGSC